MNLQSALKQHFGYDAFRPGQEEIIKNIVAGKDVVAILPTGMGKSFVTSCRAIYFKNRC